MLRMAFPTPTPTGHPSAEEKMKQDIKANNFFAQGGLKKGEKILPRVLQRQEEEQRSVSEISSLFRFRFDKGGACLLYHYHL